MNFRILHSLVLILGIAVGSSSCSTVPTARLDKKTEGVLTAMSAKLAAAHTVRVSATRQTSPGFTTGVKVAQSAQGRVLVRRPDKLVAQFKSSEGARTIGFDGKMITVVDHAAHTHSVAKAPGDIDKAVRGIQALYGVTPPVAELLVNHPKSLLLEGVKKGAHTGVEAIDGIACDRLAFEQDGLSWQLWVATTDQLPRRIALAYPNGEGGAPLTVVATMKDWQLNAAVSDAELHVKAPSGSRELEMLPLNP